MSETTTPDHTDAPAAPAVPAAPAARAAPAEPPTPAPQGDGMPGPDPHSPADAPAPSEAPDTDDMPKPAGKPPSQVRVAWAGDRRFDAGRPDGPTIRIDGDGKTGPSPVDAFAASLAACVSVDVVEILAKRRTPVRSLTVDVTAERANAIPARVVRVELRFRIAGAGIERVHAERAIELSKTKYCSVGESLNPDIPVSWTLELEGA